MKSITLGLCISVCLAGAAQAQVNPQDLKWGPAPPIFAPGAQMAVLSGDPSKAGEFVVRLKVPAGYQFAAHHHPTDEYVTVISGDFSLGMGDKLDTSKGAALGPGGFAMAPTGMNHYAWTKDGAIVQVSGAGPFVVVYVNPADDPTKR
jgi:quercetin dioxygenase-like cupin family protein